MLDGGEHADRLVAHLPAVTVRAMQEIAAPTLASALDIGQLVGGAGREQHLSRLDIAAAGEPQYEAVLRVHHAVFDELHAVAPDLRVPGTEQFRRGVPSRDRNPCMCAAGALRGVPASMITTRRLARPRTKPALRPAGPPPMIATS